MPVRLAAAAALLMVLLTVGGCGQSLDSSGDRELPTEVYLDKVHGSWQATMVANRSGIELQGLWLQQPSPDSQLELLFPEQWSTDDDTHVEWLDLHIMEVHGIEPGYEAIRDEWVDHLNNDIWVATLRARELMDDGVLPPNTGTAANNPDGAWSMDAQLETELFGLISPGQPGTARTKARFFAKVTNSGFGGGTSVPFMAHLYAQAFFESDIDLLLDEALAAEAAGSEVAEIVTAVRGWHEDHPDDWRQTRVLIRDRYDTDPAWWASKVNFAVTIMALLYGEGDLIETVNIAGLGRMGCRQQHDDFGRVARRH